MRLQERLGVQDKEFEKYRIAIVIQMKPHYIDEDEEKTLNIKVRSRRCRARCTDRINVKKSSIGDI